MAKVAFTNAYVAVNSVALSNRGVELTLDIGADEVDQTTFGDSYHNLLPGTLKNFTAEVTFAQDFGTSTVDVTLNSLVGSATLFEVRPVNTTVGTGNPKWSGTGIITAYSPMSGKVGDMLMASITVKPADGTGIVRGTA